MAKTTRIALLLTFAAMPLLEIGVLIRAGQSMGLLRLSLLVIATAILGTIIIRRVGLSMIGRAVAGVESGRDGLQPLFDGMLQVIAGMLLIFPGLISDAIGVILLVPIVRQFLINNGLSKLISVVRFDTEFAGRRPETGHRPEAGSRTGPGAGAGPTIEGEYERIDEKDIEPGTDIDIPRRR